MNSIYAWAILFKYKAKLLTTDKLIEIFIRLGYFNVKLSWNLSPTHTLGEHIDHKKFTFKVLTA